LGLDVAPKSCRLCSNVSCFELGPTGFGYPLIGMSARPRRCIPRATRVVAPSLTRHRGRPAVTLAAMEPAAYRFPTYGRTDRRNGPGWSASCDTGEAPAAIASANTASGSSTTRKSQPVAPPIARGLNRGLSYPPGETRNAASAGRQPRNDLIALAHLMKDPRAECRPAERGGPVDPQLG